jgi:hypothetical protein
VLWSVCQGAGIRHRTQVGGSFAILSPHNARLSKEAAIRLAISTAQNGLAGIDGKFDPR